MSFDLRQSVAAYTAALSGGELARAYRGVLSFCSALRTFFARQFAGCAIGTLYPGYLDMTYFALTPPELRNQKLKIAVVYLHAENRFEFWLAAANRAVQTETAERLSHVSCGKYSVTHPAPGVDAIIVWVADDAPDFGRPETLMESLAKKAAVFAGDMTTLVCRPN